MLVNMIPCYMKLNVVIHNFKLKEEEKKLHSIHVFTRLIREAVRWISGQASGGVLDVNVVDAKSSVLQCLKEKHPEPSQIDENAFLHCDVLPPLIEIVITTSHVERLHVV